MGHKNKINRTETDSNSAKVNSKNEKLGTNDVEDRFSIQMVTKKKKSKKIFDKTDNTGADLSEEVVKSKQKIKTKRNESESKHDDERKRISFAEDVVDNENHEPPRKKNKKSNSILIKPTETPTEEELLECKKPENIKAVTSKRLDKKMKYEKLKADQKIKNILDMQQKNLTYLSSWKYNRSEWKFNKVQQYWLYKNMFDDKLVPDTSFETLTEYFGGAKGHIRQIIQKECLEVIEKAEGENEIEDETKKIKYIRARNMLQLLND